MVVHDSAFREFALIHPWESGSKYELSILPGAFTDIFDLKNDTIDSRFTGMKLEDLGKVVVLMTPPIGKSVILELTTTDGKLLESAVIKEKKSISYLQLSPAKYGLRAIIDRNGNGAWDTGEYLKHIQPEHIVIYDKPVEVRANWDLELKWDLSGHDRVY